MKLICNVNEPDENASLQENLNILSHWCTNNRLSLNVPKCNVVSFFTLKTPIFTEYVIDETELNRSRNPEITPIGNTLLLPRDSVFPDVLGYNSILPQPLSCDCRKC